MQARGGNGAQVSGTRSLAHGVLQHYEFYTKGSDALRDGLIQVANVARIEHGRHVLEAGRSGSDVLLVGKGSVRVFIAGATGREVTLYHIRPGQTCPVNLGSALLSIGAFANATADGEVDAAVVPAREFLRLGELDRRLHEFIFAETVTRFGEVIALVREITTRRVDHRLADHLLDLFENSSAIPPRAIATQQEIALELGTAREVVSRRLHELERRGAVQLGRGRIELIDEALLRRLGSE